MRKRFTYCSWKNGAGMKPYSANKPCMCRLERHGIPRERAGPEMEPGGGRVGPESSVKMLGYLDELMISLILVAIPASWLIVEPKNRQRLRVFLCAIIDKMRDDWRIVHTIVLLEHSSISLSHPMRPSLCKPCSRRSRCPKNVAGKSAYAELKI